MISARRRSRSWRGWPGRGVESRSFMFQSGGKGVGSGVVNDYLDDDCITHRI